MQLGLPYRDLRVIDPMVKVFFRSGGRERGGKKDQKKSSKKTQKKTSKKNFSVPFGLGRVRDRLHPGESDRVRDRGCPSRGVRGPGAGARGASAKRDGGE